MNLSTNITVNSKNILIFHTHTCESYTQTDANKYESTGNYRTTDLNHNVVRVGDELQKYLTSYGHNVIHNKTFHDYPAYTGSYGRSLKTVNGILSQNKDTDVVIDLHRDAIGDDSYAPKVKIGDEYAAQIMFVIGTNGSGLTHDNWQQNLQFAMKVQQKANELYPGLFKPILLRNARYNQHLSKAANIIEIGATGNTLEECETSAIILIIKKVKKKGMIFMIKELVMEATNTLPDTATFEDIIDAIYVRLKIEEGIESTKSDEVLTTEELIKEIEKWS